MRRTAKTMSELKFLPHFVNRKIAILQKRVYIPNVGGKIMHFLLATHPI